MSADWNATTELAYGREAKLLCKKIVAFFTLLSKTQETGVRKLGVTQELLSLVTGLAHYLKLLIRIGLQGALKQERERGSTEGLHHFLDELENFSTIKEADDAGELTVPPIGMASEQADKCLACNEPIDDECVEQDQKRFHLKPSHVVCFICTRDLSHDIEDAMWDSAEQRIVCHPCAIEKGHAPNAQGGFSRITKLQQYVFLLRVALARLLSVLRASGTLPHTSGMFKSSRFPHIDFDRYR